MPCHPWLPWNPWTPVDPVIPCHPWFPWTPVGPVMPWIPWSPWNPWRPCHPWFPWMPVGPVMPWLPVADNPWNPWNPVFSIHYPKFDYDCYDDLINNNNMLTEYYLEITNKKYYLHKLYLEDNHIFNDIISTNNIALSKITPSNFQKKLKTILTFL
jgi:hypothetical protein